MGSLVFHRADFLQVLASKLDPASTASRFSKRLTSYTQVGPDTSSSSQGFVTLHFVDGTTSTCDVLVGADGIHSETRHCLFKEVAEAVGASDPDKAKLLLSKLDPMWSGSAAYRAVIPSERLGKINPNHSALKVPQNVSISTLLSFFGRLHVLTRELVYWKKQGRYFSHQLSSYK